MPDFRADLLSLADQINAGVQMLEQILDEDEPGDWVKGKRGPSSAARNAWGLLSVAWVNVASLAVDRGIEAWSIAPLTTRSAGGRAQATIELASDGHVELSAEEAVAHHWRIGDSRQAPIRIVERPSEPKYTLSEAREILALCGKHDWEIAEDDATGNPTGLTCRNCGVTRAVI